MRVKVETSGFEATFVLGALDNLRIQSVLVKHNWLAHLLAKALFWGEGVKTHDKKWDRKRIFIFDYEAPATQKKREFQVNFNYSVFSSLTWRHLRQSKQTNTLLVRRRRQILLSQTQILLQRKTDVWRKDSSPDKSTKIGLFSEI